MQAGTVMKEFAFNGVKIPDSDRTLSPEKVRGVLSTLYPDIVTASITKPEEIGNKVRYNFVRPSVQKGDGR